jgi:hypothetical protein
MHPGLLIIHRLENKLLEQLPGLIGGWPGGLLEENSDYLLSRVGEILRIEIATPLECPGAAFATLRRACFG